MEKHNILIIDDDAGLRKTLYDILTAKGYKTFAAKDGTAGLAVLTEHPVEVALIDLKLPDMSGIEVLGRLKTWQPQTEAIILTGNAELDSAIEATNKGAFSFLQKPYDIEQLLLHIRRALDKRESEEKIHRHTTELERMNAELRNLYEVSRAIGRTIDLDGLLGEVLPAVVGMDVPGIEHKAAVFIVEDDRLTLASSIGLSDAEAAQCRSMRLGECLCGLAALRGETIISGDSMSDPRHTMAGHAECHGNVAVPLKAPDKVVGVLCLYTRPGTEVGDQALRQLASVGGQIGVAVENSQSYEMAKMFSLHDPLTGLANRRFLQIQMKKLSHAAGRYKRQLSVIMLDVDYFKNFNDTYGHTEGDILLVKLANIIAGHAREADYAFRYGGEEFVLLLPETGLDEAVKAAERIREAVKSGAGVTVSLGVACCNGLSPEETIKKADSAMYRAKQNGRNRVEADLSAGRNEAAA